MKAASPSSAANGDRSRQRWLVGGALLAVFAGQVLAFHGMRLDDAFITYRYGENLASGHGLTFNPGERFLGSTSPGHMLLTAAAHRLVGHEVTPSVMSALGCLGWSAQVLAIFLLLQRALGALGAGLVAALVALGAASSYLWVPLETQLVAALTLFALLAARAKRWSATAALAALACLMRPDAAVLAGVLGALCVYDRRGRVLVPALIFCAIALPWFVFATDYYGSALPHSALEKFQRSAFPKYLGHMLRLFAENVFALAKPPAYYLHAASWVAIVAGAVVLARRDPFFRVVIAFALLFFAAYALLRPIAGQDWHLYPLSLLAVVFAFSGLFALASAGARRVPRAAAAVVFAALAGVSLQRSAAAVGEQEEGFWNGARHSTYRRIAGYMAEHGEPGDRFASIEVGTLAYYSGLAAYDLGGLVTDLRRDAMVDRDVRFLVLDKRYLEHAPPVRPVFGAAKGEFAAFVYYLPPRAGLGSWLP
jgi:hypothetical protein